MAREQGEKRPQWAEIAYEAIAPVYDEFTAHHDYDLWLGQLMPRLEAHGVPGPRLLDVACGTGKSFIPLLEKGWKVTACDVSPAMVAIAREKVGDRAELSVADMRELPVFGAFDAVLCLDDAVNYLLGTEELEQALAGMRRNLGPGGLLMFDVNTLQAYRTFFAEEVVVEREGRRMIWKGRSSADAEPGTIAEASFEVEPLDPAAGPAIAPELHRERHFPEAEVLAALERAGLECLDVYGHHDDAIPKQPLDELDHSKGFYIARAAG
ncbi:MAG TPA: class I SAM-dependent methyltransferase [Solirubrobacterales bacterium]|nr:class I SAM-dependent methyltransferase [Solirubrobacterales bacterium]